MTEVVIKKVLQNGGYRERGSSVPGIIRWRVGFSLRFSKDLARDESLSSNGHPRSALRGRAPTSGLASLRCRSSDSLGEFRSDECAAPVKLLEDEVQHVFLGRRLRVWQKVPPERHAFLVGDNHFTDAWVLHVRAFASEAKIPRSDPRRGYCPVDSASVIIKRGDVTPWHFARVGRTDLPQIARDEASPTETPCPALRFPEGNSILDSR